MTVKIDLGDVRGPSGTSIFIKGWHSTLEKLKYEHPTGEENEAWNVGGQLYVWDPEHQDWEPMDLKIISFGDIKGNLILGDSWNPSVTVDTDEVDGQLEATFTFSGFNVNDKFEAMKKEFEEWKADAEERLQKMEEIFDAILITNPWRVSFENLDGVTVHSGQWNEPMARLDC